MNRHRVVPATVLCVIALTGSGCETHRPTAPTPPERPAAPPPVATPPSTVPYVDPGFPPAPAGAAVYGRITSSSIPSTQRYVVLDNGRFALHSLSPRWGFHEDAGSYTRTETGAHLVFDAWSLPGPREADVTFDGHLMVVRYNLIARYDDFEDGIFERQPAGR